MNTKPIMVEAAVLSVQKKKTGSGNLSWEYCKLLHSWEAECKVPQYNNLE